MALRGLIPQLFELFRLSEGDKYVATLHNEGGVRRHHDVRTTADGQDRESSPLAQLKILQAAVQELCWGLQLENAVLAGELDLVDDAPGEESVCQANPHIPLG